jgi:hypothetical protein
MIKKETFLDTIQMDQLVVDVPVARTNSRIFADYTLGSVADLSVVIH